MDKRPYSQRNKIRNLTLEELYENFVIMYNSLTGYDPNRILGEYIIKEIKYDARRELSYDPFPINNWDSEKLTEINLFDVIEYLYRTEALIKKIDKIEYKEYINNSLCSYKDGYKLTEEDGILSLGSHGIPYILDEGIPILEDDNIDLKIKKAIIKFRNKELNIEDKKQAVRELADVFEYMRDSEMLKDVLNNEDEKALFHIANKFGIRHHNLQQKQDYDKNIWYSWMFHFYLATFHAVARMIKKQQDSKSQHK